MMPTALLRPSREKRNNRALLMQHLSPQLKSILFISGVAAVLFAFFTGINLLLRKLSGWKAIVERFPMTDFHDAGETYKKQDGVVGNLGSGRRGFLNIRLAHEGVCLYPFFARRNPCLIPWSSIRSVSVSDSSICLVVNYERPLKFFLPADALPVVKAKLSPELFHQAVTPLEAAKAQSKTERMI